MRKISILCSVAAFMAATSAFGSTVDARQHLTCRSAFGALLEMYEAHELTPYAGITKRDLNTLAQWTTDLELQADAVFERFQKLQTLHHDFALALNNRELGRLAVLSVAHSYETVEHDFKTMLIQVRARSGGRGVKVPHRIHARLTALALLTQQPPGQLADFFNENFARVTKDGGALKTKSEFEVLTLQPPVDVALRLTIDHSTADGTAAGKVLQE